MTRQIRKGFVEFVALFASCRYIKTKKSKYFLHSSHKCPIFAARKQINQYFSMPFKFSWRARTIYNTGSYCQLFVTNHQKNTETDACNPIFRNHYLQTRHEKQCQIAANRLEASRALSYISCHQVRRLQCRTKWPITDYPPLPHFPIKPNLILQAR